MILSSLSGGLWHFFPPCLFKQIPPLETWQKQGSRKGRELVPASAMHFWQSISIATYSSHCKHSEHLCHGGLFGLLWFLSNDNSFPCREEAGGPRALLMLTGRAAHIKQVKSMAGPAPGALVTGWGIYVNLVKRLPVSCSVSGSGTKCNGPGRVTSCSASMAVYKHITNTPSVSLFCCLAMKSRILFSAPFPFWISRV